MKLVFTNFLKCWLLVGLGTINSILLSQPSPQESNPLYQECVNTVNTVETKGNFAGNFPDSDASLPIGIVKTIAATQYVIAIDSAFFFPNQAYCNAFMAIDLPGTTDRIAFAAKNISVNPKGVMSSNNSRLLLVTEHIINISKNIKLILKPDNTNYIEWDCNGFKSINLKGYFEFSDQLIVPDEGVTTPTGKVIASFEIHTNDIHNFITQVNITPFCLKGMNDISFSVQNATVDLSEIANSMNMVFPIGYQQSSTEIVQWKGFYLKNFTVKLPKELSKKGQGRTSIAASNMLIDNSGVSGVFSANNILALENSDIGSWQFSIDNLSISIVQNHLNGGGMAGKLKIPLFENNALVYSAAFIENPLSNQIDYQFTAGAQKNLKANVLSSEVDIFPSSKIIINKTNGKLLPIADLTGQIKLFANAASTGKLNFERVVITNKAPFLQSGTFGFTSDTAGQNKIGKFPVNINQIAIELNQNLPSLKFQTSLNFMQDTSKGFSATVGFSINTKIIPETSSEELTWKFDKIKVGDVYLDIKTQPFTLTGLIAFRENHPVYGNGFAGQLNLNIPQVKLGLNINAIFGAFEDYKYFYVDGALKLPTPVTVASGVAIYRFMGGLYYHMKQPEGNAHALYSPAFSSTIPPNYIPDKNIGLGIKAGVTLGMVGKEDAFNADVALEVQFNSSNNGGGISLIKFTGDCFLMTSIKDREGKTYQQVPVGGFINIAYDFNKPELHAVLNIGINYSEVKGIVNSVFHVDNKDWYVYIGKPSQRGIITVNAIDASIATYFMVGNKIEPMPDLPWQIAKVFGKPNNRDESNLANAKGFAFGANFEKSTIKEFGYDFFTVYGSVYFILGFDMMMKKYSSTTICPNTGTNPGFKGWYLNGQLYAYFNGAVGVKGQVKGAKFDFNVCSMSAATMLYGELIKPSYIEGSLACSYNILNTVKGNFNYNFEVGTRCGI